MSHRCCLNPSRRLITQKPGVRTRALISSQKIRYSSPIIFPTLAYTSMFASNHFPKQRMPSPVLGSQVQWRKSELEEHEPSQAHTDVGPPLFQWYKIMPEQKEGFRLTSPLLLCDRPQGKTMLFTPRLFVSTTYVLNISDLRPLRNRFVLVEIPRKIVARLPGAFG